MMYPYQSLPENLAAFSADLRREHRFRIGPRELQDAARALRVCDLGDERAVRDVLRPVLCCTTADVAVFDRAFDDFFHPRPAITRFDDPLPSRRREFASEGSDAACDSIAPRAADHFEDPTEGSARGHASVHLLAVDDAAAKEAIGVVRSSYSPLDAEGAAPDLPHPDASWRAAALAFVAALRAGLSRRWRPARHGRRFDLRRTLRHSLHTGGEVVVPRWLSRPRRRPRIVMLVDGSRSMSAHAQVALDMAVALAAVTTGLEAFTFSTTLHRVTRDVRRAAAGERRRLDHLHHAWGGGTMIGASAHAFLRRFGDRLLGRDTVVIIASDGLEVGAPHLLRDGMARLRRRSAGVIWLNPLLETPGYEPTALGMSAARPYLSTFAWVGDPASLVQLSRVVRIGF